MRRLGILWSVVLLSLSFKSFSTEDQVLKVDTLSRDRVLRLMRLVDRSTPERKAIFFGNLTDFVRGDRTRAASQALVNNKGLSQLMEILKSQDHVQVVQAMKTLVYVSSAIPSANEVMLNSNLVPILVEFMEQEQFFEEGLTLCNSMLTTNPDKALRELCREGFLPVLRKSSEFREPTIAKAANQVRLNLKKVVHPVLLHLAMLHCPDPADYNTALKGLAEFSCRNVKYLLDAGGYRLFDDFLKIGASDKEALEVIYDNLDEYIQNARKPVS